jgi:hypothetical protein
MRWWVRAYWFDKFEPYPGKWGTYIGSRQGGIRLMLCRLDIWSPCNRRDVRSTIRGLIR